MILGINSLNHDASVCLVDGSRIKFAGHAERYSRVKNDSKLNHALLEDCFKYGTPTDVVWFEKPFAKAMRKFYAGETPIFSNYKTHLQNHLHWFGLSDLPVHTVPHHGAHAAMGFYTSGFDDATVIVVDAIGEWDTTSIWQASPNGLVKRFSSCYPHSMGLFYSAMTDLIGLKPNEEEYILMGMAAYGKPKHVGEMLEKFFDVWKPPYFKLKDNLHKGADWWQQDYAAEDIAASTQAIFESYLMQTVQHARVTYSSKNLVLVGGSALNCSANGLVSRANVYDNIWVPPNPGDAGLSLGAIAWHQKRHIDFEHAYLGHNIIRDLDINAVVSALESVQIVGVANGRAEYGPRALGNRSLLADPRGDDIKDRVNYIKKRQEFRPFAPVILEEHVNEYFDCAHHNHQYMQWVDNCLDKDSFPAICHIDGTSRVQTVPKNGSKIRLILEKWHEKTGCPMLLNTSLNIKGEPLVNSWEDAERFQNLHKVPVF